jgi:di/tricarboxylate transporter
MHIYQAFVLTIFLSTLVALIFTRKRPSFIFACATILLLLTGQLSINSVLQNFGNTGLISLILLLLISASVDKTSFIKKLSRRLITANYKSSFLRLFSISFFSSAMLNNTAVVASLIGPVNQNQHHPASKFLIPLSYAAIFGGTVTLIGTSTNLIVNSFLIEAGYAGFSFFQFTKIGLIAGLSCGILMFLLTPVLPNIGANKKNYKDYFIEAKVESYSELVGKTVEQNHLRNLPELFLVEIIRDGNLISPVTPEERIEEGDKLIFSGNIKKVDSLSHIEGLTLFAQNNGLLGDNLTEVVISNHSQLIGSTLKKAGFRALFDAAVVAIRRDGAQLSGKLGDIKLQAGDFLLLATGPDFSSRQNLSKNFFILSEQKLATKLSLNQEYLVVGGFICSIAFAALNVIPLYESLIYLLAIFVFLGITNGNEIKRNLPLDLIMVIIGALSIAQALSTSGLTDLFTTHAFSMTGYISPFYALVMVYVFTLILTELITNNAAAALMFPFALGVANLYQVEIMPYALSVALAASASFISPFGYQTNLLVFSATNYKISDFIKIGLPISLTYSTIVLSLINLLYF